MKQHLKACLIALSLVLCITSVECGDGIRALTITTFDPSGSIFTFVEVINNTGTIAGTFDDSSFIAHGYVRSANGTITTFDSTGSTGTLVSGINNAGTIAGEFVDSSGSGMFHGYVRSANGTITTFDPSGSTNTFVRGINDAGAIAGIFVDSSGMQHGFIASP